MQESWTILSNWFAYFSCCSGFGGSAYNNAANLHFQVMFQYGIRHTPLKIDVLLESVSLPVVQESTACDVEMDGWLSKHSGLHQFFILGGMLKFSHQNFWFSRMHISVKASIIYRGFRRLRSTRRTESSCNNHT